MQQDTPKHGLFLHSGSLVLWVALYLNTAPLLNPEGIEQTNVEMRLDGCLAGGCQAVGYDAAKAPRSVEGRPTAATPRTYPG